jgi:hypothetical protein
VKLWKTNCRRLRTRPVIPWSSKNTCKPKKWSKQTTSKTINHRKIQQQTMKIVRVELSNYQNKERRDWGRQEWERVKKMKSGVASETLNPAWCCVHHAGWRTRGGWREEKNEVSKTGCGVRVKWKVKNLEFFFYIFFVTCRSRLRDFLKTQPAPQGYAKIQLVPTNL